MTIRRLAVVVMLTIVVAPAGFARGVLKFTVDLRNTKSHEVHVTLVPSGFRANTATYQMPVWAPGAYSVTHYGRYVRNFKAFNKYDHALAVKQLNDDRWEISTGQSVKKIEYDVLDSHDDTTSLYFAMANIDTSLFFANATALFGYYDDDKNSGSQVTYEISNDWKLACPLSPLPSNGPGKEKQFVPRFNARNYDELADAPIIAAPGIDSGKATDHIITQGFREGSADYDVAVVTDGTWPEAKMDSLTYYLRQIVHAETDFFHDTPFKHYTFEIVAPTLSHLPSFAQGALEHANSSDYLVMDMSWPLFKQSFLPIFSHEFFHLWNVKRIHSNLLGPFDYTQRVMTKSLWMAEGITEYYAHTLLARYGIIGPERFYEDIAQWRKEMAMAPEEAKKKSLEALSIDESAFDLDEATLFYSRGPLVAMMLDLEIRSRTNNKKSLDDVMFAFNTAAEHGKTFRERDLLPLFEKYSGLDLTGFYNRYIHGTDSLPVDTYLAMMGRTPSAPSGSVSLGFRDGNFVLASLDTANVLARAGMKAGDELLAVNGTKLTFENVEKIAALKDSLTSVTVTIERDGKTMDIPVNFTKPTKEQGMDPNASPLAVEIRKGIVGQ
ncbi:MAG TPA: hypothetical protein VFH95_15445 [Candidatus Kapabacteria bacterium]|nr:hypothetical protein [Candidatus Kapabacteria bacterium]